MKNLALAVILFAGATAFAGPEDHIQNQVCYTLEAKDLAKVAPEAPTELCFETVTIHLADAINRTEDSIEVYSYFGYYQKHLQNLKLTSLIRKTEDIISYKAEAVVFEKNESHCEDGLKLTLQFQGEADFAGQSDAGAQDLTLTQEFKADVCHSTSQVETFKYIRTH